jgi:translation initiation factor IF-1
MPDEPVAVTARVVEALPGSLFRLELEREGRGEVTAHLASASLLRVRPGDRVRVELSAYDPGRGRIVARDS